MEQKHGMTGKINAAKPEDQKASSYIHARCLRSDKAAWVRESQKRGMKLTEWIIQALNEKANSN